MCRITQDLTQSVNEIWGHFYTFAPRIGFMGEIIASITGVHGYVPEHVLSNHDLEKMVDTNDEWIRSRTGIEERRILKEEGKATSDMAVEAVSGLLQKTNTTPDEVSVIICATVTPDMLFPDTANTIAHKIGASNCWGFDLGAACSGFLYALTVGASLIESGRGKKIVVVGADMMSSIVNYEDRSTCILFGDGAGAVLLEPSNNGLGIIDQALYGDGGGMQYLHMQAGGSLKPASLETVNNREHYVFQDGRPVFKAAIKGMASSIQELLDKNELSADDVDWIAPHQANLRIINGVADQLDFPMDKVMVNIQKYGNTTAATIPLCLYEWENQLTKGQKVILTAFGGGFTWGSILLEWAYDSKTN